MRTIEIISTFCKPEVELRWPASEAPRVNSEHALILFHSSPFQGFSSGSGPRLLVRTVHSVQSGQPGAQQKFTHAKCHHSKFDSAERETERVLGESSLIRIQKSTLTPSHCCVNDRGFWFLCLRVGGRQRNDLTFYLVYERKRVMNKGV